ncbi:glycoside hydrolase family 53 protein [Catenovulum sediminis]|uniref:Arabinogalactan endo-beta-1,4-galactanase n=1 Tax=Catenovulum sediminis TaxID=1740262 RepID=A0ABV1RFR2_9ALTE
MQAVNANPFYKGVDLSYVNEMEDHNAVFKEGGIAKDPYQIFADHGANLVRVRLWHNPQWTNYSHFNDVKETIQRAKNAGMQVLLDFHYSDEWTDPNKQYAPEAWHHATNTNQLANLLYQYTYDTLVALDAEGLMPELVQIGNETNGNMCVTSSADLYPIDYNRQAQLMSAGIQATKDAGALSTIMPQTILHIANPAHVHGFFSGIESAGLTNYDIIGMSYYYKWHGYSIQQTADLITLLKNDFNKEVMIVEVAHTWTTESANDNANNIINESAPGYPAPSPLVQKDYMIDLTTAVANSGGLGVVYWEPAWVSTDAFTLWGQGSHWENLTFFDFDYNLLQPGGIDFLAQDYTPQTINYVNTQFKVDMTGVDTSQGVYVTGQFGGVNEWQLIEMADEGNDIYSVTIPVQENSLGAYYFLNAFDWSARETVPAACAEHFASDRGFEILSSEVTFAHQWSSCASIQTGSAEVLFMLDASGTHTSNGMYITGDFTGNGSWTIEPMQTTNGQTFYYYAAINNNTTGGYYYLNANNWSARETVPAACANAYTTDRAYSLGSGDAIVSNTWATCDTPLTYAFEVNMQSSPVYSTAFVTGDFQGTSNWSILPMNAKGNDTWVYVGQLTGAYTGGYYYLNQNNWSARETVPQACAEMYATDRAYTINNPSLIKNHWANCQQSVITQTAGN